MQGNNQLSAMQKAKEQAEAKLYQQSIDHQMAIDNMPMGAWSMMQQQMQKQQPSQQSQEDLMRQYLKQQGLMNY